MTDDQIDVRTPFISFGIKKQDHEIVLKDGDKVIINEWNWKKMRRIKKLVYVHNGEVVVEIL